MKAMVNKHAKALIIMLSVAFSACQKDATVSLVPVKGNSEIEIRMIDSPASYTAVNIDIKSVEILYLDSAVNHCMDSAFHHYSMDTAGFHCNCADTSGAKWIQLSTNAGIYNLLSLQNGLDTIIASGQIKPGQILQLRLILGSNNSIVMLADTFPLTVPGGSESGLKLIVHKIVPSDNKLNITFDFDANTSIIETGRDHFILKPVLRLKMNS